MAKSQTDASKKERLRTIRWVVTVFFTTLVVSGLIGLVSDEVMASSSLPVAFGILLFIVLLPAITTLHLPMYLSLALDGAGIAFYLYLISFTTADQHWFFALAVPIVGLCTILCEIFAILMKHFRVSYLTTTLYFFVEAALLCMGLELLIEHFLTKPMRLTWSAIVLTVCAVISITLLTILSRQRLREAVRRRLHF